jgi:hypothetical protein
MVRQFEQTMAAPEWGPEDWEWRPTFLAGSRLPPPPPELPPVLSGVPGCNEECSDTTATVGPAATATTLPADAADGSDSSSSSSSKASAATAAAAGPAKLVAAVTAPTAAMKLLVPLLNAMSDLEQPKQALAALRDGARLAAYGTALAHALAQRPGVIGVDRALGYSVQM